MESKAICRLAVEAIEEKKGIDILVLQLKEISLITDYFVLCTGNSRVQTRAIADNIEKRLKEQGMMIFRREGYPEGRWILLDFGGAIIHVFQQEERTFYNLERLWGDAPRVDAREVQA